VTEFIWDASSYDGLIPLSAAQQARAEGIVAVTHRLTRQFGGLDAYAGANLATFRSAGFTLIGAYAVTYTSGGTTQDDLTVHYADQVAPWWRDFAGWFWQADLERWPTDNVQASVGIEEARELRAGTGRTVVLYGSHGQYGNDLASWDGPLWNADYTSHAAAGFRAMYPGDNWRPSHGGWAGGWSAYSGREPDLLQYTSSATIGGLTTCDASAYRGTSAQLFALLTGSTSSTGGTDMEQLDRLIKNTGMSTRVIGDVLADLENLRNYLVSPPGTGLTEPPPPGSVIDLILKGATATTTPIDTAALAADIASALVASNANGLTAADHAAIVADIQSVFAKAGH